MSRLIRYSLVLVVAFLLLCGQVQAQSYYIAFSNQSYAYCQGAYPGNPGSVVTYLVQDDNIPSGAIRRDILVTGGNIRMQTSEVQPGHSGLSYAYISPSFMYTGYFPSPVEYIVELLVNGTVVSRSTLSWICEGNGGFDITNNYSPANDSSYTANLPYRGGTYELSITHLAAVDVYLINNGSDFMVEEIGYIQNLLHNKLDNEGDIPWIESFVRYFLPNSGAFEGEVEDLRDSVTSTVCTGHSGCNENKVRYRVGTQITDTSALGNIAYGYVLDDPLVPGYFSNYEDLAANLDQFFNPSTLLDTFWNCGLDRGCWINTLAYASDNPDDIKQRQVGHEFATQVRESEDFDTATLNSIAGGMYLY